jgi:pimeloyl-ACP methyl ester carboxylesterase
MKLLCHPVRLLSLATVIATLCMPAFGAPKPCVTVGPACTQWVPLGDGAWRSMVYSTYSLTKPNPAIRRALIMVHGTNRNADHYFKTSIGAAFLADALEDTIVIAPSIRSSEKGCDDKLEPNEVSWSCRGDSWRSGGVSISDPKLTSFDCVDQIVRMLANKRVFPNLTRVVIAGHSAGGQFVSRYEMANRIDSTLPVAITYVVANPSSYAWPVPTRPLPIGDAAPENAVMGWKSDTPHTDFSYGSFDTSKAPAYDIWPYGLERRTNGYTAQESDQQLRNQLVSRPTTYLLSQVDTLPLGGFDSSPNAMAQGATRRARGEAFAHYLNTKMGGHASVMIIPECGHNDRCVYTTDSALAIIFPTP